MERKKRRKKKRKKRRRENNLWRSQPLRLDAETEIVCVYWFFVGLRLLKTAAGEIQSNFEQEAFRYGKWMCWQRKKNKNKAVLEGSWNKVA